MEINPLGSPEVNKLISTNGHEGEGSRTRYIYTELVSIVPESIYRCGRERTMKYLHVGVSASSTNRLFGIRHYRQLDTPLNKNKISCNIQVF